MILPQHSSPSTTRIFSGLHSPHLNIHFSPCPEEEAFGATTSGMQTTSASQPITILKPKPRLQYYNTAPSQLLIRPSQLVCMLEASEEEEKPRVILPIRVIPTVNNTRNDLCLYRERILNEAMRRRLLEAEQEKSVLESDKENNASRSLKSRKRMNSQISTDCCQTFEGTSTNKFYTNHNVCVGFSELDDGIASAEDESDMDDCAQVPDLSSPDPSSTSSDNFWGDIDDDALMPMPSTFHSISDIIGYAKVVRAQRNEALGKLNSVIGQFSDALAVYSTSTTRMQEAGQKS